MTSRGPAVRVCRCVFVCASVDKCIDMFIDVLVQCLYVSVCVCVCVREREREKEREREREVISFTRVCTLFSVDCEVPPHTAVSASPYSHVSIPDEPKPSVIPLLCVLTLLK